MEILNIDESFIVCIKPAGVISEGDGENALPSLLSAHLAKIGEKNTSVFPVHRLDKETSGVMVFARSSASAAALSQDVREGKLIKEYLAVIHGTPEARRDTLSDLLFFDRSKVKSFIVTKERKGVKRAVLDYELIDSRDGLSLLKIRLQTGRTHQIRAQFSFRKLPLAGDRRYGAPKDTCGELALLSHRLTFLHPVTREALTFIASVPTAFPWSSFEYGE